MEKFVEINSSGEVVLDEEIISMLEPKGTRLKCVFDKSKILLIPEQTTSDKVFGSLTNAFGLWFCLLCFVPRNSSQLTDDFVLRSLEATLKRLELEHKERISQGNLKEEFEQLVQRGKELIEQSNMEWQEPEEVVREMRERREMNIIESLGYEK